MGQPHKHADVIKAWADGAEIEVRANDGPWATINWPHWNLTQEYRVKHKWQKEMDAALAGKTIEYKNKKYGSDWKVWTHAIDYANKPEYRSAWYMDCDEFRIKPKKLVWYGSIVVDKPDSMPKFWNVSRIPAQDNIKLTFEEGVLIGAEVLK